MFLKRFFVVVFITKRSFKKIKTSTSLSILYPYFQTSWIPLLLFTPLSLSPKLLYPPYSLYSFIPISPNLLYPSYTLYPIPISKPPEFPLHSLLLIAFHIITSKYPTTLYIPLQSFSIYVYPIISVFLSFPSFSF